jgi:acyl-CoA thioester hydrolase
MRGIDWPVRVYYEDTDAGGVVFYARYLAYMERARTEWLRALGFDNSSLATASGVVFAVRHVDLDYLRPARLDDELTVTARLVDTRRASLTFEQHVRRRGDVLCRGRVQIVCVDNVRFRPRAIPAELLDRIDHE